MRVHHLNCGSFCPLIAGNAACHCLLIETADGLVLVDTGFGFAVSQDPKVRAARAVRWLLRPKFKIEQSAWTQVQALGFRGEDVRHIVVTHLDADHAGGLQDFPQARVHVMRAELDEATMPQTSNSPGRNDQRLWAHGARWQPYAAEGERYFGFDCVPELEGLPPEMLLIPLVGHSRGHTGVVVRSGEEWLLHAGDAYLIHDESSASPRVPWNVRLSHAFTAHDQQQRRYNAARLRELHCAPGTSVRIFSAHCIQDMAEFSNPRLAGKSLLAEDALTDV